MVSAPLQFQGILPINTLLQFQRCVFHTRHSAVNLLQNHPVIITQSTLTARRDKTDLCRHLKNSPPLEMHQAFTQDEFRISIVRNVIHHRSSLFTISAYLPKLELFPRWLGESLRYTLLNLRTVNNLAVARADFGLGPFTRASDIIFLQGGPAACAGGVARGGTGSGRTGSGRTRLRTAGGLTCATSQVTPLTTGEPEFTDESAVLGAQRILVCPRPDAPSRAASDGARRRRTMRSAWKLILDCSLGFGLTNLTGFIFLSPFFLKKRDINGQRICARGRVGGNVHG